MKTTVLLALAAVAWCAEPPPVPKVVRQAKSVLVIDKTGDNKLYDNVYDKIRKWGKWTMAEDLAHADIVVLLFADTFVSDPIITSTTTGAANASVYGNTATVNGQATTTTRSTRIVTSMPRYLYVYNGKMVEDPLIMISCEQRMLSSYTAKVLVDRLKQRFPKAERADPKK